eukprot:g8398.t1
MSRPPNFLPPLPFEPQSDSAFDPLQHLDAYETGVGVCGELLRGEDRARELVIDNRRKWDDRYRLAARGAHAADQKAKLFGNADLFPKNSGADGDGSREYVLPSGATAVLKGDKAKPKFIAQDISALAIDSSAPAPSWAERFGPCFDPEMEFERDSRCLDSSVVAEWQEIARPRRTNVDFEACRRDCWEYLNYSAAVSSGGWAGKRLVALDRIAREAEKERITKNRAGDLYIRYEADGSDGPTLCEKNIFGRRVKMYTKWMVHYTSAPLISVCVPSITVMIKVCDIQDGGVLAPLRITVPEPTTRIAAAATDGAGDEDEEERFVERESWRNAKVSARLLWDLLPDNVWEHFSLFDFAADSGGSSLPGLHCTEEIFDGMIESKQETGDEWLRYKDKPAGICNIVGTCFQHGNNTSAEHSVKEAGWYVGLPGDFFVNRLRKDSAAVVRGRVELNGCVLENPLEWGFQQGTPGRDPSACALIYGRKSKLLQIWNTQNNPEPSIPEQVEDYLKKQADRDAAWNGICSTPALSGHRLAALTRWGTVGASSRDLCAADLVGYHEWTTGREKAAQYEPGKYIRPGSDVYRGMRRAVGASLVPADRVTIAVNKDDSFSRTKALEIATDAAIPIWGHFNAEKWPLEMPPTMSPEDAEKHRAGGMLGLFHYLTEMEVRATEVVEWDAWRENFKNAANKEQFVMDFCTDDPPRRVKTRPTGMRSLRKLLRRKTPRAAVLICEKVVAALDQRWMSTRRVESRHATNSRAAKKEKKYRGVELVGAMANASALSGRYKAARKRLAKILRWEWIASGRSIMDQRKYNIGDVARSYIYAKYGFGVKEWSVATHFTMAERIKMEQEVVEWNKDRDDKNLLRRVKATEALADLQEAAGKTIETMKREDEEAVEYFNSLFHRMLRRRVDESESVNDLVLQAIRESYDPTKKAGLSSCIEAIPEEQVRLWGVPLEQPWKFLQRQVAVFWSKRNAVRETAKKRLRCADVANVLYNRKKHGGGKAATTDEQLQDLEEIARELEEADGKAKPKAKAKGQGGRQAKANGKAKAKAKSSKAAAALRKRLQAKARKEWKVLSVPMKATYLVQKPKLAKGQKKKHGLSTAMVAYAKDLRAMEKKVAKDTASYEEPPASFEATAFVDSDSDESKETGKASKAKSKAKGKEDAAPAPAEKEIAASSLLVVRFQQTNILGALPTWYVLFFVEGRAGRFGGLEFEEKQVDGHRVLRYQVPDDGKLDANRCTSSMLPSQVKGFAPEDPDCEATFFFGEFATRPSLGSSVVEVVDLTAIDLGEADEKAAKAAADIWTSRAEDNPFAYAGAGLCGAFGYVGVKVVDEDDFAAPAREGDGPEGTRQTRSVLQQQLRSRLSGPEGRNLGGFQIKVECDNRLYCKPKPGSAEGYILADLLQKKVGADEIFHEVMGMQRTGKKQKQVGGRGAPGTELYLEAHAFRVRFVLAYWVEDPVSGARENDDAAAWEAHKAAIVAGYEEHMAPIKKAMLLPDLSQFNKEIKMEWEIPECIMAHLDVVAPAAAPNANGATPAATVGERIAGAGATAKENAKNKKKNVGVGQNQKQKPATSKAKAKAEVAKAAPKQKKTAPAPKQKKTAPLNDNASSSSSAKAKGGVDAAAEPQAQAVEDGYNSEEEEEEEDALNLDLEEECGEDSEDPQAKLEVSDDWEDWPDLL